MRKYIIVIAIGILIISFVLGIYLYKLNKINEQIAFEAEYTEISSENDLINIENVLLEETSSSEYKTTPNTKIILKKYYNDCGHLVKEEQKIKNDLINKNKSEFQIEYIGWEIQKFTPSEVVLYKEINDFCNEHYLLKDVDGEIIVYGLNKYGDIIDTILETGINVKYLSDIDIENLQKGITVYSNIELNKQIEDFE